MVDRGSRGILLVVMAVCAAGLLTACDRKTRARPAPPAAIHHLESAAPVGGGPTSPDADSHHRPSVEKDSSTDAPMTPVTPAVPANDNDKKKEKEAPRDPTPHIIRGSGNDTPPDFIIPYLPVPA